MTLANNNSSDSLKPRDPALDEFIAEGKEIIERVAQQLQGIEINAGIAASQQIDSIYRDVHTLKGSSQLFGFKNIATITHAMEASLDPLRNSPSILPGRLIYSCLKNLNLLDRILKAIDSENQEICDSDEINQSVSDLVDSATSLFNAEIILPTGKTLNDDLPNQDQAFEGLLEDLPKSTPDSLKKLNIGLPEGTIRVQIALLDRILNIVGELVLVRNQLIQYRDKEGDPEFHATTKNLDDLTSELQSEVMKTRMQPIETVVSKFQRLVHETSRQLKKRADLTLEGSETELDKSLLEAVKDPLNHIIKNACDHGIELPEERKLAGKPENGHILIRAFHEGGQVVIEVSDDGRGLNRPRLLAKALEKNLISPEQASKMTDREISELIFLPGLSTSEKVTTLSGRGVGMDVVKTNIEKIGGSIVLSGLPGKGTTVQLRIPLTLSILPALLVTSGDHKFAIPQVKLVELVRVEADSDKLQIEYLQDRPMFRLRDSLIPLLNLKEITGDAVPKNYLNGASIVVLNADGDRYGLIVDKIIDTADIVVKPLSPFINMMNVFTGSTLLGDGSIALILDTVGVASFGKILGKKSRDDQKELFSKKEKPTVSLDIQEFLLLSLGTKSSHAIPLCLVQRLEEFDRKEIQISGQQQLTKYRGALLPLFDLKKILNYTYEPAATGQAIEDKFESPESAHPISVIVVQRSGRNFGFIVEEILDVVTITGQIDDSLSRQKGILGNIIHQENVIVVLDALGIIEKHSLGSNPKSDSLLPAGPTSSIEEIKARNRELKLKKIRVLYAEDVAFFRRHVSKVLNDAGIDVTTVEDGLKGLEELDSSQPEQYNLILSDIEMPRMNGLEFAKEIRKRKSFQNTPLIALTTRFRDQDIATGRQAGFNMYLEKLNPEKLLQTIYSLMSTNNNPQEVISL